MHRITDGADRNGHAAAMAAGAKDQPAMGRGMRIRHQLWEATAKGTATDEAMEARYTGAWGQPVWSSC